MQRNTRTRSCRLCSAVVAVARAAKLNHSPHSDTWARHLLRSGVHRMVAAISHVDSIAELGAVQPRGFPEADILSARPPRLLDRLDDRFTIPPARHRLQKTIWILLAETLQPTPTGELR